MENHIVSSLENNIANVRARITRACEIAGRSDAEVRLVAVSKLKPLSDLVAAAGLGILDFGENYVQEWREKSEGWPSGLTQPHWHLIGPVQTNKVKYIVGKVALIHSVDRRELIDAIAFRAEHLGIRQSILIQVKIGNEETKHGFDLAIIPEILKYAAAFPGLSVEGIMTLPPVTEIEAIARGYFRNVTEARNNWLAADATLEPLLRELSMGTSGDFLWAVEEGATIVRVGTAIFGSRSSADRK